MPLGTVLLAAGGLVIMAKGKAANALNSAFWKVDPRGNKYDAQFLATEKQYGLPSGLLRRMAYQESRFNPLARSPVGALGLMQFMPKTAAQFNINPLDPVQSIKAAGLYMSQLYRQTGTWSAALAAYNWGIGNVKNKGLAKAPAETLAYMKMAKDVGVA
jgi:soluble lytic murein transglycosylase-like protein